MPREIYKSPVLMVHGICADQSWQDRLSVLYGHFFKAVPVRYKDYQGVTGAAFVICEPYVILGVCLVWLAAVLNGYGIFWTTVIVAPLLMLAFRPWAVEFRRHRAMQEIAKAAGPCFSQYPHLIAHSFGTHLSLRLLEKTKDVRFEKVVLCGSVIPETYDLGSHIFEGQVYAVRNDWTKADLVVRTGAVAGKVHSLLGASGTHGFSRVLSGIHRLTSPTLICRHCLPGRLAPFVHDVDCSGLGHSDTFVFASHSRMWWLPFLLGLDAAEHQKLLRSCKEWLDLVDARDQVGQRRFQGGLKLGDWGWCNGQTIHTFFEEALRDEKMSLIEVPRLFDLFAGKIMLAVGAPDESTHLRLLHPDWALSDAIEELKLLP